MQIIFFSSAFGIVSEWKSNHEIEHSVVCYDIQNLEEEIAKTDEYILIVDYDSVSAEINKLMASATELKNMIVLEKDPEIVTGKMLIAHGIKAYGNARMLPIHFSQMIENVIDGKVWTYPELTTSLIKDTANPTINEEAIVLIQHRLSPKEIEVTYFILDGLTNNAIASKMDITTRTVKAHVGSIFQKLHVSDRISLVLLLK
ncbi:MAG: LuxR C-terminal-related transcriptional regulator [Sulfurimonas sp.]|nr:LuxR C-terminal-related transcriptional regulator [Sulfurimonas sp.]MDQ7062135.1 LuxR C-terminal-related transcriptional regulator [Sulfurimonas sp.]